MGLPPGSRGNCDLRSTALSELEPRKVTRNLVAFFPLCARPTWQIFRTTSTSLNLTYHYRSLPPYGLNTIVFGSPFEELHPRKCMSTVAGCALIWQTSHRNIQQGAVPRCASFILGGREREKRIWVQEETKTLAQLLWTENPHSEGIIKKCIMGSFLDIGLTVILQLVLLMATRLSKEHITAIDGLLGSITYSEILCDLFVTGKIIGGEFESDPQTFLLGITLSQIFLDAFSNFEQCQPSISHTVSISSSPWRTC